MADEIIKELWQIKDGIASEHGYEIDSLVAHLRAKKHLEDHLVVDLKSIKKLRTSRSSRPLTRSVKLGRLCPADRWVLFHSSVPRTVSGG